MDDDLEIEYEEQESDEIDWRGLIMDFAAKYENLPVAHSRKTVGNLVTDYVNRRLRKTSSYYKL